MPRLPYYCKRKFVNCPRKMSDSATLELPCLGLPFQLGMLYDCRRDALVPGITLWNEKQLNVASSEKPQPSSTFEIIAEDSIKDKMFSLGVEGSLSLSLVGGLVNVSGSAKYVHDRKSSENTARVTLKYMQLYFQIPATNHGTTCNNKHSISRCL